ncbi:hypothetical protein [Paraglaciecola marina]|uniref:hypothetical protein n=1 Tax=Paraglaciecola marina TaxID=2500157 RepID=UPI00105F9378|nr:hypothetical protein [Paraglaciecola marina]
MFKKTLVIPALITLYIGATEAQEHKRPDNFMTAQLSEQLLNETQAFSNDRLVNAQATLLRKHYLALIEAGFSKSEALQIVVAKAGKER